MHYYNKYALKLDVRSGVSMCCFLWHVDNAGSSVNVHVGNTGDVSPLQVITLYFILKIAFATLIDFHSAGKSTVYNIQL